MSKGNGKGKQYMVVKDKTPGRPGGDYNIRHPADVSMSEQPDSGGRFTVIEPRHGGGTRTLMVSRRDAERLRDAGASITSGHQRSSR